MESVNKLICYLTAIQAFAKDIHYTVHGDGFYSKHEFADRIQDGLYDFIDQLKETCLLGNDILPLPSMEYMSETVRLLSAPVQDDDNANFKFIQRLIIDCLVLMQEMLQQPDTPRAEVSLVDSIAQDLQQKLGLINLQVKE